MENALFEKTPVPKAYMKLALPVVMSMMVSLVYNMVDTYFIALTGNQNLVAGVSLIAPIFTLMIAFGDIFGLGGSSLIARLFGERNEEEAKRASAFCIWGAIAFDGQPLIGYNYGAKNQKRLKEILKFAYAFEVGLGLIFTILVSLLAPMIIRVFMNDSSIVTNGALMLRCQQLGMTFMAVTLISTCVCQSIGNALGALILSISRQGLIYVIALAILSKVLGYHGVLLSQACSDLVTALLAVLIIRGLWKELANRE